MSKYPERDKLRYQRRRAEVVSAFLDFLQSVGGGIVAPSAPCSMTKTDWVYRFLGIDAEALAREDQAAQAERERRAQPKRVCSDKQKDFRQQGVRFAWLHQYVVDHPGVSDTDPEFIAAFWERFEAKAYRLRPALFEAVSHTTLRREAHAAQGRRFKQVFRYWAV